MKADLDQIKRTIRDKAIKLSLHAYEEAFAERILVDEIRVMTAKELVEYCLKRSKKHN